MNNNLSEHEKQFIHNLLHWSSNRKFGDLIVRNFTLIIAGAIIVISSIYTLAHLNDQIIFGVLVPSFIVGLLFVGLYIILGKRIEERDRVARIVEKLMRAS